MFFLKKLFKIREEAVNKRWDDTEKPFLDHLDDLRTTLMNPATTLEDLQALLEALRASATRTAETD